MLRRSLRFGVLLQAAWMACTSARPAPEPAAAEPPPLGSLPADVRPLRYQLSLKVDPDQRRFSGTASIDVQLDEARRSLYLHGRGLAVREASADGTAARYEQVTDDGVVRLDLQRPLGPGRATLRFAWDAPFDDHLQGLYVAPEAGVNYAYTQLEAIEARRAFPSFDDPQFKTPFDVTLTVPGRDLAVSNAPVIAERPAADAFREVRFDTTKPLPTYLIFFAVGPFDVLEATLPPNEVRKTPLVTRGIAPRGRGKELAYALKVGGELLAELERYFDIPFPYEKLDHVAAPDYQFGAMENAGAILYRETVLLLRESEGSATQRGDIVHVVTHEMAHQWFGDLVTLRWWNDAWLNESFATWMDHRTVEVWDPRMGSALELLGQMEKIMHLDARPSARRVRQPVERSAEIWNQFDPLSYEKGAVVLGMFERWAGPEKFREGVRSYLRSHAHGGGSTDELLASISSATGRDVAAPFRTFIEQPGVPLVEARVSCEGAPRVLLRQSPYRSVGTAAEARTWQVPVCARFGAAGRQAEACTLLAAVEGELPLPACPQWLVPNAQGVGYYRWSLPPKELRALSAAADKLSAAERLSLGQAMAAAVRSGATPFADAMATLEPLARDRESAVAIQPSKTLEEADLYLGDAQRERLRAYASALYRPVLERLGWTEAARDNEGDRRLRKAVVEFLLDVARDPSVESEAARRGQAFFGRDAFVTSAVASDAAGAALQAWVRSHGAPAFDAVLARLSQTDDATQRKRMLSSLAKTRRPPLVARALDLVLDARVRQNERTTLLEWFFDEHESRPAAWDWLRKNGGRLREAVPEATLATLTKVAAKLCDPRRLAEADAFFASWAEQVAGARRPVRESIEAGRICVAVGEAQRASAAEFLRAAQARAR